MIPKIIHYCWFGRNPKPKLAEKCIESWKKYCPDYEIVEWNEDNYDISAAPLYVRQAYEAKKWAFMTDYIRLQVVYENGGIYLDTDVELRKPLTSLLETKAYFGFENGRYIATGLGFGAEKGAGILKELMDDYREIPFVKNDGSFDTLPCPQRNTEVFLRKGLVQNNCKQTLCGDILILPTSYLCPIDYTTNEKRIMSETISIHWYQASWQSEEEQEERQKTLRKHRRDSWKETRYRIMTGLLGEKTYERLKRIVKGSAKNAED